MGRNKFDFICRENSLNTKVSKITPIDSIYAQQFLSDF